MMGSEQEARAEIDRPRSRAVFAFHKPELLAEWVKYAIPSAGEAPSSILGRMGSMPVLVEGDLWPARIKAIRNLEKSLAENRPRSLIQMATGSGKTYTAISFIYRLIKFAGARRVPFLVEVALEQLRAIATDLGSKPTA